jgi:hypothetical protein
MVLATWNCFQLPFAAAFMPTMNDIVLIYVSNNIIDSFFLCDILINFRTTYFSTKTGDEVMDAKKIAKKYVFGGQFWLDLLATLPIDTFVAMLVKDTSSERTLQLLGLLKLTRIIRLSRIINYMRTKEDIKVSFKLV